MALSRPWPGTKKGPGEGRLSLTVQLPLVLHNHPGPALLHTWLPATPHAPFPLGLLQPWLLLPPCPLLAGVDSCALGQPGEQNPVGDPHAEVGKKTQLIPRGSKEEKLKSILVDVQTMN